MAHAVSDKGVVGLGALGNAVLSLLPDGIEPPPAVLFTVKAFDLKAAMIGQDTRWPRHIPFISLANGYLDEELAAVARAIPHRALRVGITTIGSTMIEGGAPRFFIQGSQTRWGPFPYASAPQPPGAGELALLARFPGSSWEREMRPYIRGKWILNVVINSLCAAYRLPQNADLERHKAEIDALLPETIGLAVRLWPDLHDVPDMAATRELLWNVVRNTGQNENSMARDIRAGRPTESQFLAGMAERFAGFPRLRELHRKIVTSVES
jgi:ketopantoate reductase